MSHDEYTIDLDVDAYFASSRRILAPAPENAYHFSSDSADTALQPLDLNDGKFSPSTAGFTPVFEHVEEQLVTLRFDGSWRASPAHTWTDCYGHPGELLRWFDPWEGQYGNYVMLPRLHVLIGFAGRYKDRLGRDYWLEGQPQRLRNIPGSPRLVKLNRLQGYASGSAGRIYALRMFAAALDETNARGDNETSAGDPMRVVRP